MNQNRSTRFPKPNDEAQKIIDVESIRNIHWLFLAGMVLVALSLVVFILTMVPNEQPAWFRIGKFVGGFAICLAGFVIAGRFMKKDSFSHTVIEVFKVICFVLLAAWAIFISYREYVRGEQIFIFFAVELLMVCFLPLRPVISIILGCMEYAALYAVLYFIDGARGVLLRNYVMLAIVSVTGMIVIYYSRVRMADQTVKLKKANEMLEYANRHDALTKLRNRKALQEDLPGLIGKQMTLYMIDINYFKEINDTYGHLTGDAVLEEAGNRLKGLFPDGFCYRYGGDEFLVLSTAKETYKENGCRFMLAPVKDSIFLSIGSAAGTPETTDQFERLIAEADARLYEIKQKTHRTLTN